MLDADFLHRKYLLRETRQIANSIDSEIMLFDVGCGWMPYRQLFRLKKYLGFDTNEHGTTDFTLMRNGKIPLETSSTDVCVSWQVLEHVEELDNFMAEIKRCLKSGGRFYLTTHGFFRIPAEADYWRWTAEGLSLMKERAGLSNVQVLAVDNFISVGMSFINWIIIKRDPARR